MDDVRKAELVSQLEDYINRYLDKQWVVSEAIDMIAEGDDEARFLHRATYEFKVYS